MEVTDRTGLLRQPRYEPPSLAVLGTLHGLTEQDKRYGETDGFTFLGQAITNNS